MPPIGIGPDCVIEHAIVDKNARVGRGVRIVNDGKRASATDGEGYYIRDGIVIDSQERGDSGRDRDLRLVAAPSASLRWHSPRTGGYVNGGVFLS